MNKTEEQLRKKSPVQIRNKKASFEYFFIETFTAGIVLTGTEIKSIRLGKASLVLLRFVQQPRSQTRQKAVANQERNTRP